MIYLFIGRFHNRKKHPQTKRQCNPNFFCSELAQIPCTNSWVLWTCHKACPWLLVGRLGQHTSMRWPTSVRSALGQGDCVLAGEACVEGNGKVEWQWFWAEKRTGVGQSGRWIGLGKGWVRLVYLGQILTPDCGPSTRIYAQGWPTWSSTG